MLEKLAIIIINFILFVGIIIMMCIDAAGTALAKAYVKLMNLFKIDN